MPKGKVQKILCVDDLRHSEYYNFQTVFDDLYARSTAGETFTDLMRLVLSRENILLAYRNIKTNTGSHTAGVDHQTIKDIGKLTPEEVVNRVRYIIEGRKCGYIPKPVRRKDIPKSSDPTKTRPLGIPCIWDRLIQQCIKQIMEPICEAKFCNTSYGFRPQRSTEHAIAEIYRLMQRSDLHYIVEFDIKGFFDNVNHAKLKRQIWALGIRDKHLIWIIQRILKAPIRMPDGSEVTPDKGTPQGGILSPLLANIVLNELDHWVESQWKENPVIQNYSTSFSKVGTSNHSCGYRAMRRTQLKEMNIVRYADDFRILCRTKKDAERTKIAVTQWLSERLKLEVSPEKTRVVNAKRRYSEFLGFKIKVTPKAGKCVVSSYISDKQVKKVKEKLVQQAHNVANPRDGKTEVDEVHLYNAMVLGIHNYYRIATNVVLSVNGINRSVMTVFTNRLIKGRSRRLLKTGRPLYKSEIERFGAAATMRYMADSKEPIYPISYIQHKNPMCKKKTVCCYTAEGRKALHDNLRINVGLMQKLMQMPSLGRSVEFMDNRISLFSAQWGKCAVTGVEFTDVAKIHCHHIIPVWKGGSDKYQNLVLVTENIHRLIHATKNDTIEYYMKICNLNTAQLKRLNKLRVLAGNKEIA